MTGPAPAAVASVTARIAGIDARFAPERGEGEGGTVNLAEPFEPFGEVYQRALEARPATPPAASAPSLGAISGGGGFRMQELWTGGANFTNSFGFGGVNGVTELNVSHSGSNGVVVPPELAVYGNGLVPASALQPLAQSGHRLYPPAASSWDALVGAAAADGIQLKITDSYRPYDEQVDLAQRKGLYRNGGLAAVPGTSNHGWGMAVDADVTDPATLAWLRQNGPAYGWVESVPREPWHWEYQPDA